MLSFVTKSTVFAVLNELKERYSGNQQHFCDEEWTCDVAEVGISNFLNICLSLIPDAPGFLR
jgi:hypothetical protein